MKSAIVKHRFSNEPPLPHEMAVGEIVLQIFKNTATLYTKSINGTVVEIGKGALSLYDLEDIDLTNVTEGSFLVKEGDKFVATKFIGDISSLSDIEITNPQIGDYLRYDPLRLSFRNVKPSYNLYQLLDVDIPDPTTLAEDTLIDDNTLAYDHSVGKFKLRPRIRNIRQLEDVDINTPTERNQILALDSDGIWKNMDLSIKNDTSPVLGNNLDANGKEIINSSYKINTVNCTEPLITIQYSAGDYWILKGVPKEINEQCIINIDFSTQKDDSIAILMLEIIQDTGNILIAGLENIQYEDGKPLQLSGAGKTDLITITIKKTNENYTSYITPTALNLATVGNGGIPAYRYDKNRYPEVQIFDIPNLYDDYFEYVELLLNFEEEISTGKLWQEDKSIHNHLVTTTATHKAINIFTYGLQEYVADFLTSSNNVNITANSSLTLLPSFTYECFIQHPLNTQYLNINMEHILFRNNTNTFSIKYKGDIDDDQNTYIEIKINDNIIKYFNAYNYFRDKNNKYVHIAVVRNGITSNIDLFIDGIRQIGVVTVGNNPMFSDIVITTADITGFVGLLNTVRITNYARYNNNFQIPNMRFGLTGGANDILEAQIFDTYMWLDKELEYNIFC